MLDNRTKVLLILPEDVVHRARIVAAKSTISLKLPVSLQIVLRALIEEGLKREGQAALRANIERQAHAVRQRRSATRRAGATVRRGA
jgi:hypothetical protein